jgi:short-subunit dehydrogenase
MHFKDHRALITGASSGIGADYARKLAEHGAAVVLCARRVDRLEALARELRERYGSEVEVIQSDLSAVNAARSLFDQATAKGAQITILVNNAGLGPYAPFLETQLADHLQTLDVNIRALTELSHLFGAHMRAHGRLSFIQNVASISAFQGVAGFSVYSASKSYVRVFSEILREELRGTNVQVSSVCPGGTYTEFFEHSGQKITEKGRSAMMSAEEVVRIALVGMRAGRSVIVPGVLNQIACFLPRFMPRGFALKVARIAMERSVERVTRKN